MNHLSTRRPPRWRRSLLVLAGLATAGLALLPVATASAHVRVTPDNPTTGGFSALTFRVPNESATAGTVKLSVTLPKDTPFLYVSTKPVPGWTAAATKTKLAKPVESYGTTLTEAVSEVTWTADKGVEIGPGEYQEFSLSVGPLPDPATVLLPTTQTYSDGTVVAWDQPTPASGEEPEHPAPVLEVVAGRRCRSTYRPRWDPVAREPIGGLGRPGAGLGALAFAFLAWRRGTGPTAGSMSDTRARSAQALGRRAAGRRGVHRARDAASRLGAQRPGLDVSRGREDGGQAALVDRAHVQRTGDHDRDQDAGHRSGRRGREGDPQLVDTTVEQGLLPEMSAGEYTVEWRVTSADGHPINGEFSFTVRTGSAPTSTPTPVPTTEATGSPSLAPEPDRAPRQTAHSART